MCAGLRSGVGCRWAKVTIHSPDERKKINVWRRLFSCVWLPQFENLRVNKRTCLAENTLIESFECWKVTKHLNDTWCFYMCHCFWQKSFIASQIRISHLPSLLPKQVWNLWAEDGYSRQVDIKQWLIDGMFFFFFKCIVQKSALSFAQQMSDRIRTTSRLQEQQYWLACHSTWRKTHLRSSEVARFAL